MIILSESCESTNQFSSVKRESHSLSKHKLCIFQLRNYLRQALCRRTEFQRWKKSQIIPTNAPGLQLKFQAELFGRKLELTFYDFTSLRHCICYRAKSDLKSYRLWTRVRLFSGKSIKALNTSSSNAQRISVCCRYYKSS